ncbi:MAG: hypothetical protein ACYCW6_21135, partial [Candidatus Xenobia bacterium]
MNRGAALATVLMVISVTVLFAFVLTASAVFHLRLSWHESVSQQAADDAEAGLAGAIDYFLDTPAPSQQGARIYTNAGQDGKVPPALAARLAQCKAWITFDPKENGQGIFTSVNNLPRDSDSETDPVPLASPYPDTFPSHPSVPGNGLFLCVNATVRGV